MPPRTADTMESVPETSQLPTSRPSPHRPVPTLLIHESSPLPASTLQKASLSIRPIPNFSMPKSQPSSPLKPPCIRRVTEPSLPILAWDTTRQPLSLPPRTSSPFSGGHTRSQSLMAPQMSRAKSMPGVPSFNTAFTFGIQRPSSPAGASMSPSRQRAMRKPVDEGFPSRELPVRLSSLDLGRLDTGNGNGITEEPSSIPEEEEEKGGTVPRLSGEMDRPILGGPRSASPSLYPGYTAGGSYQRQRRPSSPLRNYNYASSTPSLYSNNTAPTSPSSMASSPSPLYSSAGPGSGVGRYEPLSGYNFPPSVCSNPTTPSSLRSRSPSISSLETIPDSPDAEEAAVEAERVARKLRKAKEREDDDGNSESGSDGESVKSVSRGRRVGVGSGVGRDKSKRWSVCGAERRQDLDLETIWED